MNKGYSKGHAGYNVFGEEKVDPVFVKGDHAWGHIPAMKGYKNY